MSESLRPSLRLAGVTVALVEPTPTSGAATARACSQNAEARRKEQSEHPKRGRVPLRARPRLPSSAPRSSGPFGSLSAGGKELAAR